MERQVTDIPDDHGDTHGQVPPDEVLAEASDAGLPFRGIVIGSMLGAGVWLLVWLLA